VTTDQDLLVSLELFARRARRIADDVGVLEDDLRRVISEHATVDPDTGLDMLELVNRVADEREQRQQEPTF
jgi:hypothetical protein